MRSGCANMIARNSAALVGGLRIGGPDRRRREQRRRRHAFPVRGSLATAPSLPPKEMPVTPYFSMPIAATAFAHRGRRVRPSNWCAPWRATRRSPAPRTQGPDASSARRSCMRLSRLQPAAAMKPHQRLALPGFEIADAEPVRLDEFFLKRHVGYSISCRRGRILAWRTIRWRGFALPSSCADQHEIENAGADQRADLLDLLEHANPARRAGSDPFSIASFRVGIRATRLRCASIGRLP